jgi:ubiquitin-conjugating enzyme E2 D/E
MFSRFFQEFAVLLPHVMRHLSYRDVSSLLSISREARSLWRPVLGYLKTVFADKECRLVLMEGSPSSRFVINLQKIREIRESFCTIYQMNRMLAIDKIWPLSKPGPTFRTHRVESEIRSLRKLSSPFIAPIEFSDHFTLKFAVLGVEDAFQGELFVFSFRFSPDHPFMPPSVRLMTPVPGIRDGDLQIDMLDHKWSPAMTLSGLLVSIQSLLNRRDLDCFHLPVVVRGEEPSAVATAMPLAKWHSKFMY